MKHRIVWMPLWTLLLFATPAMAQELALTPVRLFAAQATIEPATAIHFDAAQPQDEAQPHTDTSPGQSHFAQGQWVFNTYIGGGVGDTNTGEIITGHIGGGYYFIDNLSINLTAFGGWVTPELDDDGAVAGLDLMLRWHFLVGEKWSLYLDGGAGIQQAQTKYPSDSHFNFRPQAGIGATLDITPDIMLMGGIRWLHISNAGMSKRNDGLDAAFIYSGLMIPF